MKKFVLGLGIGLALFAGVAFASSGNITGGIVDGPWPEGVDVWTVDGRIFVRDSVTGELVWFCEGGCTGVCPYVLTRTPTPPVDETSTPPVDLTPTPTDETPEPKPTKTSKPKCNKGGGNGGEDCDSGNNPDKGHDDEGDGHGHTH